MQDQPLDNATELDQPEIIETATDAESDQQEMPETSEATEVSETSQSDASAIVQELTQDLQRTRADFENFRKQVDSQRTQAMQLAKSATVEKFLPLIDDFSRAITAYPEQLQPLEKNLQKLLQSLGLQAIESAPGTEFNPDLHEAISVEDGNGETEVILETLRPGYTYNGSVLRAAMVKVGHA